MREHGETSYEVIYLGHWKFILNFLVDFKHQILFSWMPLL